MNESSTRPLSEYVTIVHSRAANEEWLALLGKMADATRFLRSSSNFQKVCLYLPLPFGVHFLHSWNQPVLLPSKDQTVCCGLRYLDLSWDSGTFHS